MSVIRSCMSLTRLEAASSPSLEMSRWPLKRDRIALEALNKIVVFPLILNERRIEEEPCRKCTAINIKKN